MRDHPCRGLALMFGELQDLMDFKVFSLWVFSYLALLIKIECRKGLIN